MNNNKIVIRRVPYAVALLAVIFFIAAGCTSSKKNSSKDAEISGKDINSSARDENSTAAEQSALKIIIYTDFQCGACERLNAQVEPQLREFESAGMGQIEMRIVGALGGDSMIAAEAALCTGDQGKFLEYHDALFSKWRQNEDNPYAKEKLIELAASLGMDAKAMRLCLDDNGKRLQLQKNMSMAKADGVNTLPAVFINGIKIEGFKPLETYIKVINSQLEK